MNANEFLHKKDVAYMNRLSTSLDFNKIVSLMEEYAALRQPPVINSVYCDKCNKELKPIYMCTDCLKEEMDKKQTVL
jgi:hypothetical protein